jgi:hypothetical protein
LFNSRTASLIYYCAIFHILLQQQQEQETSDQADTETTINSPADIYGLVQMGPRSILKSPSSGSLAECRASLGDQGEQKSVRFAGNDPQKGAGKEKKIATVKMTPPEKVRGFRFYSSILHRGIHRFFFC